MYKNNDRAVSLNAVITEIGRWLGYLDDDMIMRIQTGIKMLPSVTPKTGHWIIKGHNLGDDYIDEKYCCSECGERALAYEFGTHPVCLSKFCPNCGAKMTMATGKEQ